MTQQDMTSIGLTVAEKQEAITLAIAAGYPVYRSGNKSMLKAFIMICIRAHGPKLAAKAARKVAK